MFGKSLNCSQLFGEQFLVRGVNYPGVMAALGDDIYFFNKELVLD